MKEHLVTADQFLKEAALKFGRALFRGCNNSNHPLVPSVGRPHPKIRFNTLTEEQLLDQFRLRIGRELNGYSSDLAHLVMARHYGLRTRLLDWTSNPYVALYFAVHGFNGARCHPFCVYVVNDPRIVRFSELERKSLWHSTEEAVFFEPPHIDDRIVSQRAFLSLHSDPYQAFTSGQLEKFNLLPQPEEIVKIEQTLLTAGVSHATIYPGIDGVCREINDSPSGVVDQLNIERKKEEPWKAVPYSWASRPWEIVRKRLIVDRLLSEFLEFKADASVIGITVEENGKAIGSLLGYEPGRWIRLFENKTERVVELPLNNGAADHLQVSKDIVDQYFPHRDVTFRTRRPLAINDELEEKTRSAIYGSEYFTSK